MQPYDPYQAPSHFSASPGMPVATGAVPPAITEAMRQTRPWVLFLAILGFVASGLLLLAGALFSVVGLIDDSFMGGMPLGPFMGIAYVIAGGIYVVPSLLLWRYASSIGVFLAAGEMQSLSEAIGRQKSFWRFAGIASAVMMGLYLLALVGGVVAGILAASMR